MIRMSKETDYGVILLAHFASGDQLTKQSARQLAAETKLSLPMVSKVLKILARQGLLASHRGVKGGYSLARPANTISVVEIIQAVEGPIAMTECIESPGECCHEPLCQLQSNWRVINDVVMRALSGIKLSDMIEPLTDRSIAFLELESASSKHSF